MLNITADDFGLSGLITDRIVAAYQQERVTCCSAMTFMEDSERAAQLALECGIPVGLHLNLTTEFTGKGIGTALKMKHKSIVDYLNLRKLNQLIFNPLILKDLDYVYKSQWDEFCRLYGMEPARMDGHQHMHLCMNMLVSKPIPKGLHVRRNFTFNQEEKSPLNRLYRHLVDQWLKSRYICTDYFFSLVPIIPERHLKIILLSKTANVEIMTDPGEDLETNYLMSAEWRDLLDSAKNAGAVEWEETKYQLENTPPITDFSITSN